MPAVRRAMIALLFSFAQEYLDDFLRLRDHAAMMEVISLPPEQGGDFRVPNLTSYEIAAEPGSP